MKMNAFGKMRLSAKMPSRRFLNVISIHLHFLDRSQLSNYIEYIRSRSIALLPVTSSCCAMKESWCFKVDVRYCSGANTKNKTKNEKKKKRLNRLWIIKTLERSYKDRILNESTNHECNCVCAPFLLYKYFLRFFCSLSLWILNECFVFAIIMKGKKWKKRRLHRKSSNNSIIDRTSWIKSQATPKPRHLTFA